MTFAGGRFGDGTFGGSLTAVSSFTITPTHIPPSGATQTLILSGTGTAWSVDTFWDITLHGPSLHSSAFVVSDATNASWVIQVSGSGTIDLSDGTSTSSLTISVVAQGLGRAQFRDTVMLRSSGGELVLPPSTALAALCDVGTTNLIAETVYADDTTGATLANPVPVGPDGSVNVWLLLEREFDLVVTCPGYASIRVTVTADSAALRGVDNELRAYIQQIMAVLDPTGPPPPSPT